MYKSQYLNFVEAVKQGGVEGLKSAKGLQASKALMRKESTTNMRETTEDFNKKLAEGLLTSFKSANDDVNIAEEEIRKYLKGVDQEPKSSEKIPKPDLGLMSKPSEGFNIVDFIAEEEQFRSEAYDDFKQMSIGYGTKAKSPDEVITEEEARKRLKEEVDKARKSVIRHQNKHGYDFNQSQVDALTSFTYNLGSGGLNKLTAGGTRGIEDISDTMLEYVYAGGKKRDALVDRRQKEYEIFNRGN